MAWVVEKKCAEKALEKKIKIFLVSLKTNVSSILFFISLSSIPSLIGSIFISQYPLIKAKEIIVLKRLVFWSRVVHIIFVLKRVVPQKCSRKMDNFLFGQRAPRHQSSMILKYYGLVTCVFGYWKGVGKLEAVVSLDTHQIIKYQVLQKLIIFCCLVFEEFDKEILKSGIFLPVV